jgi:hypothetical protein
MAFGFPVDPEEKRTMPDEPLRRNVSRTGLLRRMCQRLISKLLPEESNSISQSQPGIARSS